MTQTSDEHDVETRAQRPLEQQAVGSAVPQEQARVIPEESLERTEDPEGTRHASTQTAAEQP